MGKPITVIGSPISPYVRKVLAILALKKQAFEIDPIVAFYTDERFKKINPLRRIPVLIDGETTVVDSSVIAAYLEDKYPTPSILPAKPADRAKARWLEEFADTRMGDVFLWKVFNAVILKPSVWGEDRDLESYRATLAGPVVEVMDYLETQAPESAFVTGEFGLGDIAVAVMFRNMRYARWTPDESRWPKASAWIARTERHPALATATEWADAMITTPIPEQRAKAREIGAPLTESSLLVDAPPSRGPMTVV
jgi:glutathione S-transferase